MIPEWIQFIIWIALLGLLAIQSIVLILLLPEIKGLAKNSIAVAEAFGFRPPMEKK